MTLSRRVMQGYIPRLWLVLATLTLNSVCGGGGCERGQSWWDRERGACIPCTRCDSLSRLAVKYPCEVHRDTICQPLYQVRIPPFNAPVTLKDNDTSDPSEYYFEYSDYDSEVTDDNDSGEAKWDVLQTSSLVLAATGCVVFFLVVLVLSLYNAKQWKVLKQALKSDVQDLTAKLKLMESGGEAPAEPVMPTNHHIYCNIHVGKESLLGPDSGKKGFGNVYTQEKHAS